MTLSSPVLLIVGLLVVAGLFVGVVMSARRRATALAAAGISIPQRRGLQLGRWLTLAGIVMLAIAVAGPLVSLPVGRSASTVILAMDASNSMGADDVAPSRLKAAEQAAISFIDAQPANVDIGVVGFDQGALTTSLPSADHSAATAAIKNLRVSGGTSLTAAILASLTAITGKTIAIRADGTAGSDIGYWGSATIVLFSDGEDQNQTAGAAATAAVAAQNAGVHIETVGVGTAAGTTVEVEGYQLHTALDQQELTTIAETTGGSYHPASDTEELDGIASTIDLRRTVADQQVPLAGAFIAVALALLGSGAVLTRLRTGRLV